MKGKPGEGSRVAGGGSGRVGDAPDSAANEVHLLHHYSSMQLVSHYSAAQQLLL
jgi:hypothetical protein